MQEQPLNELLSEYVTDVAPQLLGYRVRTGFGGAETEVIISEVEAYASHEDPASHSFSGPTPRNQPMYGEPGTLYVYLNYGIHFLMNVVVGPPGTPHAVLLRGGTPTVGLNTMQARRGRSTDTANGPGKLTQALGVTLTHNATSLLDGPVRLLSPLSPARPYVATKRIGISKATNFLWRYTTS